MVTSTDSEKKKVPVKRKAEFSSSEKKSRKLIRMPSNIEPNDNVASRKSLHPSKDLKTSATLEKISKDCTKKVSTLEQKVPLKDDRASSLVLGNGLDPSELTINDMLSNEVKGVVLSEEEPETLATLIDEEAKKRYTSITVPSE